MDEINYMSGFGNHFATEALANALPKTQNAPQQPAYGLYAEQLSGTAFTAPKQHNQRSWLYRIRPSVMHGKFQPYPQPYIVKPQTEKVDVPPTQMRWDPLPKSNSNIEFVESLQTYATNGCIETNTGASVHMYCCTKNMNQTFFCSHDGELLVVPQCGQVLLKTEMGLLNLAPEEIAVIPRGIKFKIELESDWASGYICENHGMPLKLPERGPIGANGLANERDFQYPVAAFEDNAQNHKIICKFQGKLWQCEINHSPLDIVAWHGNYAPYKYNLKHFNTINSVSFDHIDPSIFTVLTSQSPIPGTANVDFVIFPERWMVAEHTFRPAYYHRNFMSELMGLIKGEYDAKAHGFEPGGLSIHNCMTAHGPDTRSFKNARNVKLQPKYIKNSLAFMFESQYCWLPTELALNSECLQKDYQNCWKDLPKQFFHD